MAKRDFNNNETYVIVGGGPAGLSAAETLRQSGFTGAIEVLSSEPYLPYDVTVLTKNIMKVEHKNVELRNKEFLSTNEINYH